MPVLTEEIRNRIRAEFPKYPDKRAVTLPALHIVHDAHRAVSPEAIREIAELLGAASVGSARHDVVLRLLSRGRQSAGEAAGVGLPEHFLHAARRRGVVSVGLVSG